MGKRVAILVLALLCAATVKAQISTRTKDQINSGLSEFKKVVDAVEKLAVNTDKLLNAIQKMSGFLGVAGGFISFLLAFLPLQESVELKYMKEKFAEVNMKLDRITSELDTVKDMIALENQRAVYVDDAAKIKYAYNQLTGNYLTQMANITSCGTQRECIRERLLVSESFQNTFDVKASVAKILTGTSTRTSVFGDPLLNLIQKTYKCDVSKLDVFANGVLKLAFQGQQVVLAHEKLTGTNTSIALAMKEWLDMAYALRNKLEAVKKYCYDNIDTFMSADVKDTKYQTNTPSNEVAASSLRESLKSKYPWLHWTVISYGAFGGQNHWGFNQFNNMPKEKHERKRVLRVTSQDMGTYRNQRYEFSRAIDKIVASHGFSRNDAHVIYDEFATELKKTVIWRTLSSFIILRDYDDFQSSVHPSRSLDWYNEEIQLCFNPFNVSNIATCRAWFTVRIIASFYSEQQLQGVSCSKPCSGKGTCVTLPFSSATFCKCPPYYEGENCEEYDKIDLASTVDSMLAVTTRIPKLTDVYFELLDMQDFIGASLNNVQNTVAALDAKLETKFNDLNNKITNEFQWANLITHYSDTMRDLKFYMHRFQQLNTTTELYARESVAAATAITESGKIRKWLFELNKLIVGRNDVSVLAHKPLLFLMMDKHKARACNSQYKASLDNAWRQIIVLQNMAYMMWAQAKYILSESTDDVKSLYRARVEAQTTFMETQTCELVVSNSVNLQCSGGFYLYPEISLVNTCDQNYYITGKSSTTCASVSSRCESCRCNSRGSTDSECEDLTGQCSCNNHYYGKQCRNRDCKWSPFGSYGSCSRSCDYGGSQIRVRSHAITKQGNGKSCTGTSSESRGCFNGCCTGSFHCSTNKKCIHGSMQCNYDNNCGNSQDEQSCSESCYFKYTGWNTEGGGDAVYLDRHSVDCGGSQYVMNFLKLQRSGHNIRYQYKCCRLLVQAGSFRFVQNPFTYDGNGDTVYLDRQTISCEPNGLLNSFSLSRNGNHDHWKYSYHCVTLSNHYLPKRSCYWATTSYTYDGEGRSYYLDRQTVSCRDRHFLTYLKLQRNTNHDRWRYSYRCCKLRTT